MEDIIFICRDVSVTDLSNYPPFLRRNPKEATKGLACVERRAETHPPDLVQTGRFKIAGRRGQAMNNPPQKKIRSSHP